MYAEDGICGLDSYSASTSQHHSSDTITHSLVIGGATKREVLIATGKGKTMEDPLMITQAKKRAQIKVLRKTERSDGPFEGKGEREGSVREGVSEDGCLCDSLALSI